MAGEQLIDVLAAAAVRAWLDRRAVVDTADLVAVLARRKLLPSPRTVRRRLWAWPVRCDATGDSPTAAAIDHEATGALREALWIARRRARRSADDVAPRWCACTHRVVRRALREAADLRIRDAHGAHLVLSVIADRTCCGYRALAESGLNVVDVHASVLAPSNRDGRVRAPALSQLAALGVLTHPAPRTGRRFFGRMLLRRLGASAVAYAVGTEAARQAVRTGAKEIGAVHVLAGICAVGFQQRRTTWVYAGIDDRGQAADLLARQGVKYPEFAVAVARTDPDPGWGDPYGPWRLTPGDPGYAPSGRTVFRLAQSYVDYLGLDTVTTDHLLMGCIEVDSPAVRAAVTKAGADYEALRTQAARLLIASP
jgi:hypothetical protein